MRFDVAIIGAGPGGSAAAINTARLGANVLLIDKDTFPRHKVCGEFISFEAHLLLKDLLGTDITGVQIEEVRLYRGKSVVRGRLPAPGLSITRFELDNLLLDQAKAAGCTVITGERVKSVERQPDGFAVISSHESYSSKLVINAAGRWSELSSPASGGSSTRTLIGIKQHFTEHEPPCSTDLYFFPGGYSGVQPISDGAVNVCALVSPDRIRTISEVIAAHPRLLRRGLVWQPLTEVVVTAPIRFATPQPVTNGMLNIGDAAAFIDPFLGDGISIALHTGAMAARYAMNADAADHYAKEYFRRVSPALKRAAFLHTLSDSPLAWRAIRIPGMIRLAASVTRVRAR